MKDRIINYIKDSISEFKKVKWLTPKETFNFTLNVILFTIIFSIFYGILDFILSRLMISLK